MKRLLVMVAALVLALPAVHAQNLTQVKITQAVASFSFLPLYYGKAAGIYKAEGLDVVQIATRGGGPDLTALLSGDVQFNAAAGTYQLNAIKEGRKVLNVYNFYKRNGVNVVISVEAQKKSGVSPDASLKERAAAMKGLRMGMTRPGALTDLTLRHLARVGGLDPAKDVKIVAIGGPTALIGALERGNIDGYCISTPGDVISIARGKALMWINNAAGDDPDTDPFMFQSLLTTEEFASKHPDIVRKVISATRKAVKEIASKPAAEIYEVVKNDFKKVDPKIAMQSIDLMKKALNLQGDVTPEMAKNTVMLTGRTDVTAEQLFQTFTPEYQ